MEDFFSNDRKYYKNNVRFLTNLMKFFRKIPSLSILFCLCSCIYLSRSSIVKHDVSEVISVLEVKIFNNKKLQTSSKGLGNNCYLRFLDENFNRVKLRNKENVFFYILKSKPGTVRFYKMKCQEHIVPLLNLRIRTVNLDNWVFNAKPGFINYAGSITIDYDPQKFMIPDLFGFGGFNVDSQGIVKLKVEDRITELQDFLRKTYPEFSHYRIIRSFVHDSADSESEKIANLPPVPVSGPQILPKSIPQNPYQRQIPSMRNSGYYYNTQQYNPYENYYGNQTPYPSDHDTSYRPIYQQQNYDNYYQNTQNPNNYPY